MTNAVRDYYAAIAPHWEAEMASRDDVAGWVALVRDLGARRVLDLGCGSGRIARALGRDAHAVGLDLLPVLLPAAVRFTFVQGDLRMLPFAGASFDLAVAVNDPFAHVLEDADRAQALDEATRVAGRIVIDGLRLTSADDAAARGHGLLRERVLPGGVRRCERWSALGDERYRTTYRYVRDDETLAFATIDVRAWSLKEPALRRRGVHLASGLDARPYDERQSGIIIVIEGDR